MIQKGQGNAAIISHPGYEICWIASITAETNPVRLRPGKIHGKRADHGLM
jgi:hypothetical protein